MSPGDELGKPLFEVFGSEFVVGQVGIVEGADIVDALKHDDVLHSGLRKNIPIEAGQRVLPDTVNEHAVAADAFVEHGQMSCIKMSGCRVALKARGKIVGPAVVGILGGQGSVCNGIAEGHNLVAAPAFNRRQSTSTPFRKNHEGVTTDSTNEASRT